MKQLKKINSKKKGYELEKLAFYHLDNYQTFNDFYKVDTNIKYLVEEDYIEPLYYNEKLSDNKIQNKITLFAEFDFFKIEIAGSASFIIILLIKKYIKKEKTLKKLITWI